jgi:hypothetical protein
LQSLNNCVDKADFKWEVKNMDKEELEKIESDLADKIIEEYELQKEELKNARYKYLKNKNREAQDKVASIKEK